MEAAVSHDDEVGPGSDPDQGNVYGAEEITRDHYRGLELLDPGLIIDMESVYSFATSVLAKLECDCVPRSSSSTFPTTMAEPECSTRGQRKFDCILTG
jgi:hypothetical protein